jgi:hypothetical protein
LQESFEMIDQIIRDRARAAQLAKIANITSHPWRDADETLKSAQEAEAIAVREAQIQRDAQDAAEFKAAHDDVLQFLAKKAAITGRILAKSRELDGFGNAGVTYNNLLAWQRSPAGKDWKLVHQHNMANMAPPGEPLTRRGTPPLGLSWPDIDRAMMYGKINRELDGIRSELAPIEQCLQVIFSRFPALRELQEGANNA